MNNEIESCRAKKLLFVFNPRSGMGQIRGRLLNIIDIFTKGGYDVTAYPTQSQADAFRKVRDEGHEYDMIVCSGGDGTLDETVSAIYQSKLELPLGYIPAGSTNDFAASLNIPKNMEQAAEIAIHGQPFLCDIGQINDINFVYVAAFGMFTDVSYQTDQNMKNALGHAAYILEGVKRLGQIPSYKVKVTTKEQEIEEELILGMISNSKSVGGFTMFTEKNTLLDDGVFEVLLVRKPKNPMELNEIWGCLIAQKPDNKNVYIFKTSEVHFEFEEEPPWTIDGEFGGNYKTATVTNLHKAISIMIEKSDI